MSAVDPALEYTTPETRGVCGFCGEEEGGYAKTDGKGKWQAACWKCVMPTGPSPVQKRNPVGNLLVVEPEEDKNL